MLVVDSKVIFNHLVLMTSVVCGYYTLLSISAYNLTWELNRNFNVDLPKFSECWLVPLLSAVAFFVYKRLAMMVLVKRL